MPGQVSQTTLSRHPESQPDASGLADTPAWGVSHREHFITSDSSGGLELDLISFGLADQCLGNGRTVGDHPLINIRLKFTYDPVSHFPITLLLPEVNPSPKNNLALGIQTIRVDDFCHSELGLKIRDSALNETLLFPCGVILRVLGKIPVRPSLRNRFNYTRPILFFLDG